MAHFQADWILLTEQNARAMVAQVKVIVRSGSLSEPVDSGGLANFTARALLRGTRTRPYQLLNAAIEQLGGTLKVRVDQTQIVFDGAVIAKNLDPFLELMRDILTQPAFDPHELSILQKMIQGELRSDLQDVQTVASRVALHAIYGGSPPMYAPQGTVDSVGALTPSKVQNFFDAHFVRQNLVVALVSPLGEDEAQSKINAYLGSIPSGLLDAPALPEYRPLKRRAILVPRKNLSTVPLYVAVPGVADGDQDLPGLEVGNFVFGADFTSRLTQVLRVEHGWTYHASSGFRQLIGAKGQPELFSIYTYPSVEFAEPAILKTVELFEKYSTQGIEIDEFTGAIRSLTHRYAFSLDSAEKRLGLRIREVLFGRPVDTLEQYHARLAKLQPAALNQLIRAKIPVDAMLLVAAGEPSVLAPILKAIPGVQGVEILDLQS